MRTNTSAYVVVPDAGTGPGVLVLHAWWGLTPGVRRICDRLADEGFVAMAPDLFDGTEVSTVDEAQQRLSDADANDLVAAVRASANALIDLPPTTGDRIGVLGMSMGASLALWLAERAPGSVGAAIAFYGAQEIDFERTTAAFQLHLAEHDEYVDETAALFTEALLHLGDEDRPVESHLYPGTAHWFFEPDQPTFDPDAADLAFERSVAFLRQHLS